MKLTKTLTGKTLQRHSDIHLGISPYKVYRLELDGNSITIRHITGSSSYYNDMIYSPESHIANSTFAKYTKNLFTN